MARSDVTSEPDGEGRTPQPPIKGPTKGLIGGDLEKRSQLSKVPPIELPHVLAPYRKDGEVERTEAFVRHRPLHIEIGFGRPHYLIDLALQRPDAHVLGFEIKRTWVRAAAERAQREGLTNVAVIEGDARPHLERLVAEATVDGFHVLFPDPWWKKKHHKRRVFNTEFVELLVSRLVPGGMVVAKTDVEAYADQLQEELASAGLELAGAGTSDPELFALPKSHREKKCAELGIPTFLFRFVRPEPAQ